MIKKIFFLFMITTSSLLFSQVKMIDDVSAAPNPFTNSTTINFTSKTNSTVFFSVKNVLGKTIFKKSLQAKTGKNSFPFSRGNLAAGLYIYSIKNKNKISSKRLVIQ